MRASIEEHARGVIGRDDVVRAVQAAAAAGKGRTVLVVGDAGAGKTAALAALAARDPAPAAAHLVTRELGCDDPRMVARALAAQLGVAAPEEHGAAIEAFHAALASIAKQGKRAVIVIDAIDRLRGASDGAALELLPDVVPAGVLFVLSARPGPVADALAKHPGVGRLALAPLRDDARLALAKAVAPDRGDDAIAAAARSCAGHPLFLKAILLADPASKDSAPATPEVAFGRLLNRLTRGASLDVARGLGLLAIAPSGLTRDDLAALLSSPRSAVDAFVDGGSPWLRERAGRVIVGEGRLRDWIMGDLVGKTGVAALASQIADRLAAGAASSRADALLDLSAVLEIAGRGAEIGDLVDGRFARLKAAAGGVESVRADLVRAVCAIEGDVVRAARLGVAAASLGLDASAARVLRVKTLAAAARGLPKKDGWELAEKATNEAFTETDVVARDAAVIAAVSALRGIDAGEARRVASGQPRGAGRVRALVAAGDLASALAEVDEAPEAEREEALAEVLEPLAASDSAEVTKLLPKILDHARRDRVLAALVTETKGIFLASKIDDVLRRVTSLAKIGEWDEAELSAADATGAVRAAAHERIAASARALGDAARATTHEANAKKARDALATPAERAASAREGAAIALEANPARAIALADESIALDASWSAAREALVVRARAAIAKPSGAAIHAAIASLAPLGDALATIYPELVGALASAFGARHVDAVRTAVDGVEWADRFVSALRAPAASKTVAPPPLAPAVARAVSTLAWTASPAASADVASVEARATSDGATAEDVDRLVEARLSASDRTGAVSALLAWATKLRARGDRVDAAAAEERARALDPSDPRHAPASIKPPERATPPPAAPEDVDGGWDDDGEPEPRTVREDVPRGDPPWKATSPMATSLAMAPTVRGRTGTMLGMAAVTPPPVAPPTDAPVTAPPPAPVTAPPPAVEARVEAPKKVFEKTLRSAEPLALPTPVAALPVESLEPILTPPPPPPEDDIEAEDAADQTSIMGAAERKALQQATRAGDAVALKQTAERIAAQRDEEERALAKKSEGHETARKILAARDVGSEAEAYERPTAPPVVGTGDAVAIPPAAPVPADAAQTTPQAPAVSPTAASPGPIALTSPAAASPAPMPATSPVAASPGPMPIAAPREASPAPPPARARPSSRAPVAIVTPQKSPALVALAVLLIVAAIALVLVKLFVMKR